MPISQVWIVSFDHDGTSINRNVLHHTFEPLFVARADRTTNGMKLDFSAIGIPNQQIEIVNGPTSRCYPTNGLVPNKCGCYINFINTKSIALIGSIVDTVRPVKENDSNHQIEINNETISIHCQGKVVSFYLHLL